MYKKKYIHKYAHRCVTVPGPCVFVFMHLYVCVRMYAFVYPCLSLLLWLFACMCICVCKYLVCVFGVRQVSLNTQSL